MDEISANIVVPLAGVGGVSAMVVAGINALRDYKVAKLAHLYEMRRIEVSSTYPHRELS